MPDAYEYEIEDVVTGVERDANILHGARWLCTTHQARWISDHPPRPGSVVTIAIKETA